MARAVAGRGDDLDVQPRQLQVLAAVDEALALGESLIEPRVVYRAVSVTRQEPDGSIIVDGMTLLRALNRRLGGGFFSAAA